MLTKTFEESAVEEEQLARRLRYRNPEVVGLLELYLDIAKRHKFSHVAIAMCKYHEPGGTADLGACDYAGDVALQLSGRETLQRLIGKLDASIDNWMMPPRDETLDASHVCYNVATGPLGFDFIYWLVDAEMTRVRARPDELRVGDDSVPDAFKDFPHSGGRQPMFEFLELRRRVGILHAHILKRAAQRGDGGILQERTVPSIVCAPVGDQLRLHGLVVSIIEDGVEYHDADRDLLHSRERQFGG